MDREGGVERWSKVTERTGETSVKDRKRERAGGGEQGRVEFVSPRVRKVRREQAGDEPFLSIGEANHMRSLSLFVIFSFELGRASC
jgi:hypothetical protein